jgi:hypothetical protein
VLRVLGNELELPRCEYRTPSDVAAEVERELGAARDAVAGDTQYRGAFTPHTRGGPATTSGTVVLDVPISALDALVRRAEPLQDTVLGRQGAA